MDRTDMAPHGQLTSSAAEVYEEFFVPALFGQWPDRVLEAAGLRSGDEVLDVGCGTGVLARTAARRLDGAGSVTGLDLNDGMLDVARDTPEAVVWLQGPAEHLPFAEDSFDRVLSQFALMFLEDPVAGLAEMSRVCRPGGSVTVATWASIEESPGYAAMVELLRDLFGDHLASALLAPFTLGREEKLRELLTPVLPEVRVARHEGVARFESLEAWVHTDVRGWTLAEMIDDRQYAELLGAAKRELARFTDDDGRVSFGAPALIATASVAHT